MPFVDQRVILNRMAAKDRRMAARLRLRLTSHGTIDQSGTEDAQTSPAPNRNERPLQEVPILARRDSTPDSDPVTVQNTTSTGNPVAPHDWRTCPCMACLYARSWWVA